MRFPAALRRARWYHFNNCDLCRVDAQVHELNCPCGKSQRLLRAKLDAEAFPVVCFSNRCSIRANDPAFRNNSSSGTLFYAFDERGNVAERVSSTGSMASTGLYDAFGQKLADNPGFPGSPNNDPYGFGVQVG